jgi:hypothetical protein
METVWVEEMEVPDGLAERFFLYTTDGKTTIVVKPSII